VPLIEQNEIVQALPSDGPDEAFAECIRRWLLNGCSQYSHPEVVQRQIERRRKDRVAIVNDEFVRMRVRENFSKLLGRPFCGGMSRDITVQNPPRADFHRYEHIQNSEGQSDRYKEVAGHNRFRLVPNERGPALIGVSTAGTLSLQVLPNGSR
jgi:hypothetical protein